MSTENNNIKTFVLDTNVLLHDPECIFKFEENTVVIPVEVLSELDRKKTAAGALGASARQINRYLRELFESNADIADSDGEMGSCEMTAFLPESEGKVMIVINHTATSSSGRTELLKAVLPNLNEPDHRILASALYVKDTFAAPVVLVTKDNNMAVKGMALGLEVQDYENDRVEDMSHAQVPTVQVNADHIETLITKATQANKFRSTVSIQIPELADIPINQYILLSAGHIQEPARHLGEGVFASLPCYRSHCSHEQNTPSGIQIPEGVRVIPRNPEQWVLMDAILNPEISFVSVEGKAGTGKTYIAIAAAMVQVLSENNNYEKLYISRPTVDDGKDLGALPGELEAKMAPYMQSYYDNLDQLFTGRKKGKGTPKVFTADKADGKANHGIPRKPYQKYFDMDLISIEAPQHIRGRSIPNAMMIVDETQNLTPHQAKTIITRMGEGSKLIFLGDSAQIDTPYLDAQSNGLVHASQKLVNLPLCAHIRMIQGVRSELSDIAADIM